MIEQLPERRFGKQVRTTCVGGWVPPPPSVIRRDRSGPPQPNAVRRAGLPPLFSPSQLGTIKLFSIYSGTAGQTGLSPTVTTLKCPTKLSHFRDEWDTFGTKQAETEAGRECVPSPHE